MSTPKKRNTARAKAAPAAAEAPDGSPILYVRGLTPAEVEELEAMTAEKRAKLAGEGGTTSRNAVLVQIIREALAARRAALEASAPPAPAPTPVEAPEAAPPKPPPQKASAARREAAIASAIAADAAAAPKAPKP